MNGSEDSVAVSVDPEQVDVAEQQLYQRLSSRAAKGVAVITTRHQGWDYAAVVTDYLSVSYDPPSMLVSLYSLSRMVEAIEESGRWALSLLSANHASLADSLAAEGAPLIGLLDHVPHFRYEDAAPPLVSGGLAWFELRTAAAHEASTHTIIVGDVTRMGYPVGQSAGPLVRYQSEYNRF